MRAFTPYCINYAITLAARICRGFFILWIINNF